jgi:hypothetical protein
MLDTESGDVLAETDLESVVGVAALINTSS